MKKIRTYVPLFILFCLPIALMAQGAIQGTVATEAGEALAGANVVVEGTDMGAAADLNGAYIISNVPAGTYTLTASVIGYEDGSKTVVVPTSGTVTVNFSLTTGAIELSALEVLASRATRNTPVAFTNVNKEDIELRLGSQDVPMILNTTPSVYATMQGGGAGDARVNVRGFNQRNVAVMINGVPVNDMENAWVYWSNWDGIADATSSIQLQRGLSAVNLATPSIGGTMNIITDPSVHKAGGLYKREFGSGNFVKTTFNFHSGLINDKLALSGTIVRKTGDGLVDKCWTDAWAYYFGASYALNDAHRFEFYTVGAPQRHGQNRYMQNIASFDSSYAKEFDEFNDGSFIVSYGDTLSWLDKYSQSVRSHFYNENWNVIDPNYITNEYYYMYGPIVRDRYSTNYLNERENYYHKPQVNLNWYWTLNDQMRLSSVFYYSGGSGGGTGTYNDIIWDYSSEPSRIADWNATIAANLDTLNRKGYWKPANESVGFLRNSINRQWTLGAISKLSYDLSEDLKLQFGVDWRTAEIEHAREVRNLLGGTYVVNGIYFNKGVPDGTYGLVDEEGDPISGESTPYTKFNNEFDMVWINDTTLDYDATYEKAKLGLGDIMDYHFTNIVNWLGFFGQGEYTADLFSAYGMAGYSMAKYHHTNHFKKASNYEFAYIDSTDDGEAVIDADWITSMQVKGGGLYHLMDGLDLFANFGYVQKVPIFDQVIDDYNMALSTDPQNELFISTEGGVNFRPLGGMFTGKFNFYYTMWRDRSMTRNVRAGAGTSGDTDIIFLTNLDQDHMGIEAELAYQPMAMFRLDGALSYGMWNFVDDATGTYKEYATGLSYDYVYSVKDLKVGDMPQTIVALGASCFPIKGATIQAVVNYYDRHWGDWDPISREVEDTDEDGEISEDELEAADRTQSWEAPGYMKIDLHAYYDLPIQLAGVKLQAFVHIFNLLDETFIQDATDNSAYNSWDNDHDADDAEVYMGLPRSFNAGLTVRF